MLVLWSLANEDEIDLLLRFIKPANLTMFPEEWCLRGDDRSVFLGSKGRDADYLFYNNQNERLMSSDDAYNLIRMPRARLPAGRPFG